MENSIFKQCNGAGDVEYAYASNQSISVVDIPLCCRGAFEPRNPSKIYDVGETANRVSGTELKREAASESMVRAVVLLALSCRSFWSSHCNSVC